METVTDYIFGCSKITAEGDCSHEIKRCLLLGRKVMANLDSILKSRDITFSTKDHLVKGMVFRVVMHGCESWTIKKGEHRRIDAFELWCWCQPLDQHLSAALSAPISCLISNCQHVDQHLSTAFLATFSELISHCQPLEKHLSAS